jgi:hypothetical protein
MLLGVSEYVDSVGHQGRGDGLTLSAEQLPSVEREGNGLSPVEDKNRVRGNPVVRLPYLRARGSL